MGFLMPDINNDQLGDLSPDGRQFVFACRSEKQKGIFLIEKGEKQPRQLVDFGYWPKWSPDGRYFVFARAAYSEVGVANAVYLYDVEKGILRQLSPENGRFYACPSWSPDGRWIICAGGLGSLWEIWLLSATTGEAKQLTNYGGWVKWPMWSQADAAIYFLFDESGFNNLWRAELDTHNLQLSLSPRQMITGMRINQPSISRTGDRLVFESVRREDRLEWMPLSEPPAVRWEKRRIASPPLPEVEEFALSPDGEQVVLEQYRAGRRSIVIFSFLHQSERVVYQEQDAFAPAWSHGGKWIAFDAGGGDRADIWRVPANGGAAEKIVDHPGADWLPTYSPDGRYLCFLSNRSGQFDLWLMNLHTGETTQLTNTLGNESRGFWSQDGNKLAFFQNYPEQGNAALCVYDFFQKQQQAGHWFSQAELAAGSESEISVLRKLAWSQDGRKIYFAKTKLLELDLASLAVQPALVHKPGSVPTPGGLFGVVGDRLYMTSAYAASINTYLAEIVR
jgi:Tol biopolymer transport system component